MNFWPSDKNEEILQNDNNYTAFHESFIKGVTIDSIANRANILLFLLLT